jgi:putative hydrolase of the HAD superfamily
MSALRAIFFDAVGTLIHPEPSAAAAYWTIGRRFGSRRTQADIATRFAAAFQKQEAIDRQHGWVTNEEREYQRWKHIVAEVLDDATEPAAVFTELYEHFKRPSSWRCDAQSAAVLTSLRAEGLAVGLASNFDGRLRGLVRELKPLSVFGDSAGTLLLAISSEVGYRKPAPEFYRALCQSAGCAPAHLLYVGDDLVNDYEGARSAGFNAILFDPRERFAGGGYERIGALTDLTVASRERQRPE